MHSQDTQHLIFQIGISKYLYNCIARIRPFWQIRSHIPMLSPIILYYFSNLIVTCKLHMAADK